MRFWRSVTSSPFHVSVSHPFCILNLKPLRSWLLRLESSFWYFSNISLSGVRKFWQPSIMLSNFSCCSLVRSRCGKTILPSSRMFERFLTLGNETVSIQSVNFGVTHSSEIAIYCLGASRKRFRISSASSSTLIRSPTPKPKLIVSFKVAL